VVPELMAPASSAILAAASTVHVTLAMLRRHRSWPRGFSAWALPGFVLAVLPWLFPTPGALAALLIAHLLWFAACERLFPPPAPLPPGWTETKVLKVLDQTEEIRTFRFRRPKGFDFKPGQFLTVQIPVDGKPMIRCYSICSAPETRHVLEISVKRQGVVSGALHATLRKGSVVRVRRPAGPFVYPAGDPRPLVLLAGGVGITPLISMLRHAVVAEPARRVTLVLSVRTGNDIPFREELATFSQNHSQARVVLALTRGEERGPEIHRGRVDAELIRRLTGDPASAVYCICGPGPMIDGMKELLASLGVPKEQVRAEAFEAAVASASASAGATVPVDLVLARTGSTIKVPPGRSLLEAAEAAGAEIPFSCRAGVCQSCRTRLISGEVDCEAPALDDTDRDGGYIYPCVAWAKTNCTIEA
jgi:ferredoxin-NADP reductase